MNEHQIEVHHNRSSLAVLLGFGVIAAALFWVMIASWMRQGNSEDYYNQILMYLQLKITFWLYVTEKCHWKLYFDTDTGEVQICSLFKPEQTFHVTAARVRIERYRVRTGLRERLCITAGKLKTKVELGIPEHEYDPYREQSLYGDFNAPELLRFLENHSVLNTNTF